MNQPQTLLLASASPARLKTLKAAGVTAKVQVSNVDEDAVFDRFASFPPERIVAELALAKLQDVAANRQEDADLILACDSMLLIDGELVGKPRDAATAIERWQKMRGSHGVLYTGHALALSASERSPEVATSATKVFFADLTDAEIRAYVATGEPLKVAGAFTIDGLGGPFVTRIEGDHHSVVGLSLPLLRELLARFNLSWFDLA